MATSFASGEGISRTGLSLTSVPASGRNELIIRVRFVSGAKNAVRLVTASGAVDELSLGSDGANLVVVSKNNGVANYSFSTAIAPYLNTWTTFIFSWSSGDCALYANTTFLGNGAGPASGSRGVFTSIEVGTGTGSVDLAGVALRLDNSVGLGGVPGEIVKGVPWFAPMGSAYFGIWPLKFDSQSLDVNGGGMALSSGTPGTAAATSPYIPFNIFQQQYAYDKPRYFAPLLPPVSIPLAGTATTASTLAAWIRPRWGRRVASSAAADLTRSGLSISASTFTLMAWVRTIDSSSELRVGWISNAVTIGTNGGSLRIRLFDNNTSSFSINYSGSDDLQWHHLALTFDGATARAYVDGSQVVSAASTVSGTFADISVAAISGGSGIAEVAHWKIWAGAALSAAEIVQEKDFYTPSHANTFLYGWWQLGWQNVTLDSSGNGRTLTDNGSLEAQTESPGLPLTDLAGAATSASTLAGTLSVAKPLAGAATSASTLAGVLSQAQPLVGAATSATALAGTLSQAQPLAGAATDASTLVGTLSQQQPLVGAQTTASTLTGDLRVAAPLAGVASSASTLAGTLGQALVLAGAATTTSSLTGALGIAGTFSGNAMTASSLAGTLSVDKPIAGAATTSSALTGVLSQQQPLNATASSASTLAGALTTIKQCQGAATTASSLTGTLSVALPLSGAASSASTLTGALSLTQQLAAAAQSASTLTGALTVQNLLSGAATSSSALTGALTILGVVKQLVAAATTGSTLSGSLTVTIPATARGNVVTNGRATADYGAVVGPQKPRRVWPPRPR